MKKVLFFAMALFTVALTAKAEAVTESCGTTVTITATPNTGYHFVKWSDGDSHDTRVIDVLENTSYIAYFAPNKYWITFLNDDNTEFDRKEWEYGTTPTCGTPTPKKRNDVGYTYTFKGWNPVVVPVSGEATYKAEFDSLRRSYEIVFANYDGTILQKSDWLYLETPEYTGAAPVKPMNDSIVFTWNGGWEPTVIPVAGPQTYKAHFDESVREYFVTLDVEGLGTATYSGAPEKVAYGTTITLTASTTDSCTEFDCWSDGNINAVREITVKGDINLVAKFKTKQFTITVTSDNVEQGTVTVTP